MSDTRPFPSLFQAPSKEPAESAACEEPGDLDPYADPQRSLPPALALLQILDLLPLLTVWAAATYLLLRPLSGLVWPVVAAWLGGTLLLAQGCRKAGVLMVAPEAWAIESQNLVRDRARRGTWISVPVAYLTALAFQDGELFFGGLGLICLATQLLWHLQARRVLLPPGAGAPEDVQDAPGLAEVSQPARLSADP